MNGTPNVPVQNPSQVPEAVPQNVATNNNPDVTQPKMSEDEMKEFIAMYPYMADYPIEEIHRFWYNNIKNQNSSGDSLDLNSEEIEKLEGADANILDESRNSDQIKQELRRKRKRPKKKKNLRKVSGDDNNNMIDDISEFSRGTIKNVIPRSEIENNRSRSSSIISLQKSVPENILLKNNNIGAVRSEASGSRGASPRPRMIHKQMTDKKIRANGGNLPAEGENAILKNIKKFEFPDKFLSENSQIFL